MAVSTVSAETCGISLRDTELEEFYKYLELVLFSSTHVRSSTYGVYYYSALMIRFRRARRPVAVDG